MEGLPTQFAMQPRAVLCLIRRLCTGCIIAISLSACLTHGATLLVYNPNNTGAGSLRQAVSDNNTLGGGNTIVFSNVVTGTITLTSGELLVNRNVTIVGPGEQVLTISGNNASRVFRLTNAFVNLSGLTLANGASSRGSGILQDSGTLNLMRCTLSNNVAGSIGGGGIAASGVVALAECTLVRNRCSAYEGAGLLQLAGALTLTNCTFLKNTNTAGYGGALGVDLATTAILKNCSFISNSAAGGGGALINYGTVAITNCTLTGNTADFGGAIQNTFAATTTVRSSIIAGNRAWVLGQDCQGSFSSGGFNLIGVTEDNTGWTGLGDQGGSLNVPLNPLLGPVQNNGGPTLTMSPQAGSPAVDQGNSSGLATDQRGAPRPFDFATVANVAGGDGSDIGAVEFGRLLVVNTSNAGSGSLRGAILNASPAETMITFASNVVGSIILTSGVLTISQDLTILGPGAKVLTLSGNNNGRIFEVLSGSAAISGLTLANGRYLGTNGGFEQDGPLAQGGGIFNQTTLALGDCILSNNVVIGGQGGSTMTGFAGGGGNGLGGGIANLGTLSLTNCYLVANASSGGPGGVATLGGGSDGAGGQGYGGGIYSSGPLTLVRCALANNSASGAAGGGGSGSGAGGGIYNDANVTLLTCTIASNSASGSAFDFGGGIYHNGTMLTLRSSTIAGNQADFGGGVSLSAATDFADTILAYNAAGSGPDCSGTINSSDYNLIQSTSGATITGTTTHNLTGQNPLLGALADNGGLSVTMAPLAGSPVLDKGKNSEPSTDQRGAPRPFDFASIANAAGGDGSDIGAFESGSPQLAIQKAGSAAVLSWPSYYGGVTVQSVTNVALSNAWTTVAGTPVVSGNQYVFTNSPVPGDKFYRLKGN